MRLCGTRVYWQRRSRYYLAILTCALGLFIFNLIRDPMKTIMESNGLNDMDHKSPPLISAEGDDGRPSLAEYHIRSKKMYLERVNPLDEERMERRRSIARQYCWKKTGRERGNVVQNRKLVISKESRFLHCPVGKAASTFWSRFVLSLTPSGKMESPFDFPFKPPGITPEVMFVSLGSLQKRHAFLSEATKNIFLRSPWGRFFSGYVDKALAPNPTYWKAWGVPSIEMTREGASPSSSMCGDDVTFAELMQYIDTKLYKTDEHFKAASSNCQPCEIQYDIIGKLETFSIDLRYVANRLNLSLTQYFNSSQFRKDFSKDAIEDSILSPFSWMEDILQCITKYEAGLRIWRKLQIRGVVSRRMLFPYTEEQFQKVTAEEFIQTAVDASLKSTDRKELRKQKKDAFLEAYSTVPRGVLETLKQKFRDEFEIFDYQGEPANVFRAAEYTFSRGAYDWRKVWKA